MTRWADSMDTIFRRCDRDDGFTLAEVLVSVVILFFALTAVLTLLLSNVDVSSRSAARTAVVNAGNSYIEQLRAMNYSALDSLETTTIAMGEYAVEVEPTVELIEDPEMTSKTGDYKLVTIQLTGTGAGVADVVLSMQTIIREDASGVGQKPKVEFTDSSPAEGDVVWGASIMVGATASIDGGGASITSLAINGGPALMSSGGETAVWSVNSASVSKSFYWDSTLEWWDPDELKYVERTPDGERTLKSIAFDSNQKNAYRTRTVLIDNYAPDKKVASLVAQSVQADRTHLSWARAMDGLDPAYSYRFSIRKQPGYWTDPSVTSGWERMYDLGFTVPGSTLAADCASSPLSRYEYRIRSVSPRGLAGSTPDITSVMVSRPSMSGTFTTSKSGADYTGVNSFIVNGPTFRNSSASAKLLRSSSPDMSSPAEFAMVWSSAGSKWVYTDTLPSTKNGAPKYYYQAVVTVRPEGYLGGTDAVVSSQVLTTSSQTASTGTMTLVNW